MDNTESTTSTSSATQHAFQAEVSQLLHLVTHSLYSNPEIFLRELVSNASDACDKLRFEALQNNALYEDAPNLELRIDCDPEAGTLSISDNGIGMSAEEAIAHLGTIAKSGTKEFVQRLGSENKDSAQLIGQFGVGFYSAFIVAQRVVVESRRAGLAPEQGVRWSSSGSGDFSTEAIVKADRGTRVVLHLREDAKDYLDTWRVKQIVEKYADHIGLPILMRKEIWDKDASKYVKQDAWESINQAQALWTRAKKDISQEQYEDFYTHLTHDDAKPLAYSHNRVEGASEYTQLLYIPSRAPQDLWNRDKPAGIKLYVKRVFIMEDAQSLMPVYLRFVRGIVDSADLPLNVSRELLQESRDVRTIREGNTRRVLSMLEDLSQNADQFARFCNEFGAVLKEGLGEDFGNRERIAKLLRFGSTWIAPKGEEKGPEKGQEKGQEKAEQGSQEQKNAADIEDVEDKTSAKPEQASQTQTLYTTSLAEYKARMKEGQEAIYYLVADSHAAALHSPQLELFKKKGIEVVLLFDRVDEWALSFLPEFDGTPLQSVAKGAVDLGKLQDEAEKQQVEAANTAIADVLQAAQTVLQGKAKSVRVGSRLVDSASCLVVEDGQYSLQMLRLLKQSGQPMPPNVEPVLELNPAHPLVKKLEAASKRGAAEEGGSGAQFADLAHVLFDQALLAEGGMPEDPAAYVQRVSRLLA